MKIYFSQQLKQYVEMFPARTTLATELGIDDSMMSLLMNDKRKVSAQMIAKILTKTGFDFEKAFRIEEDGEDT